MKNHFLENVQEGKHQWWRYLLTLIFMILCAGIFIVIFANIVMPIVKANFEKTPFSKLFVILINLSGTFGALLSGLWFMNNKLHNRNFTSLIHCEKNKSKFSVKFWILGFLLWCPLIIALSFLFQYQDFERFLSYNFSYYHVLVLFFIGLICIGIQSTAEEIIFRGYALQGMSLRLKNILILALVNSLVFALAHLGYGIQSLIESFIFGLAFTYIVLNTKRIELAAGAHSANNLILILFFPPDFEKLSQFQWAVDWLGLAAFIFAIIVLYFLVRIMFTREK
jgi:membrane protease YdiL (CAAX protease family)